MRKKEKYFFKLSNDNKAEKDFFSVDDYVDPITYQELYENPFLYNCNSSNVYVDSIEDFAVKYKNKFVFYGSFIRNSYISRKHKVKYTRKYFGNWKKDFNYKVLVLSDSLSSFQKKEFNNSIKFYNLKNIIMNLVCVIIMLFFIGIVINEKIYNSNLIESDFIKNLSIKISEMFSSSIGNVLIFGISFIIFMPLIYWAISKHKLGSFNKERKKHLLYVNSTIKDLKKVFKKSYKRTKYYYIKQAKKDSLYFADVDISSINSKKYDYKTACSCLEKFYSEKGYLGIDNKKRKVIFDILIWISFITSLICLGVIVYNCL